MLEPLGGQLREARQQGFTLIELSIVLVIIGLIVGGVLVGQNLIRQAELNSILADVNKYTTAAFTFQDKYRALPGDMPNATSFWGANPNCSTGGTGTGTQTCNGNGNGLIDMMSPDNSCCESGNSMEQFLFWQHLGNAGLIAGQFSGGGPNYWACTPGVNCPGGKINQTYFEAHMYPPWGGSGGWWAPPDGNYLMIGLTGTWGYPLGAFLSPAEAMAFDRKVDDGKPGTGSWLSSFPIYTASCAIDPAAGGGVPDGSVSSEGTSVYNLSYKGLACALMVNLHL